MYNSRVIVLLQRRHEMVVHGRHVRGKGTGAYSRGTYLGELEEELMRHEP